MGSVNKDCKIIVMQSTIEYGNTLAEAKNKQGLGFVKWVLSCKREDVDSDLQYIILK